MPRLRGYLLWISGLADTERTAFAVETRTRLVQHGVSVKLLGIQGSGRSPALDEFTPKEAGENILEFYGRFSQAGVVCILAEGCFDNATRQRVQQKVAHVITILVHSSAEACQQSEADHGSQWSIMNAPIESKATTDFEEPVAPDILFQAGIEPLTDGVNRLMRSLQDRGLILHVDMADEENLLMERLRDLGYL